MNKLSPPRIDRRGFLKLAGGALAGAAGTHLATSGIKSVLRPVEVAEAAGGAPDLSFVTTDGWISLPGSLPPKHPDPMASAPLTTYMFGFRNVTGLSEQKVLAQKEKAQHMAPLWWLNEGQPKTVRVRNLGLAVRPDLTDPHTLHFHGFRDQIPYYDGEPMGSFSIPIGRSFDYYYVPRDPGTYMYHCHVEDVEHVHMGMTGIVFIRPAQDGATQTYQGRSFSKFVYNDGDGFTGYDREFVVFLSEVWIESHWADAHIQLPDWTLYNPDFLMMNGRVYPDTLAPNGAWTDPNNPTGTDATGDLIPPQPRPGEPAGIYDHLQYQPYTSLIRANAGESVLIRFVNLGFTRQTMALPGLKMRVVGKDAHFLRAAGKGDTSYETNTIAMAAGESFDAIIKMPPVAQMTKYVLYNRNYKSLRNGKDAGYGGQMTELRVLPAGTLPPQTLPNT